MPSSFRKSGLRGPHFLEPRREPGAVGWVPAALLALGLAGTAIATSLVMPLGRLQDEARFDTRVAATQATLAARMDANLGMLTAGEALFAASREVTPAEWGAFVRALSLPERFPGARGLGFARREGEGYPIRFLEPRDWRNVRAMGYDMYTDPIRREAMARARDTGEPALSGRVTLVQEAGERKQAGFLIYLPVYQGGRDPGTLAARRAAIRGFAYAPFRADDLFNAIFRAQPARGIVFSVFDGPRPAPERLLHDHGAGLARFAPETPFVRTRALRVAGRTWTVVYRGAPGFATPTGRWLSWVVAGGSLVLTLMLTAIARVLTAGRARAEREVARRTEALTAANEELQAQSEELLATNTELQALSKTLASERQLTERLIAEAPILIAYVDRDLVYRWSNPVHERSIGVPRAQYLGKPVRDFLPAETYRQVEAIYREVLGGVEIVKGIAAASLDRAHPDVMRDWEYTYVPVHGDAGTAEGILMLAQDVTERVAEARRQREQIERLEEIDRLKDQFLGVLSHELRTPLNAVFGFASILGDEIPGPLNAEQHAYLDRLMGGTEVLLALINDLLDMSRIQAGKFSLAPRPLAIGPVIEETLANLASLAEQKAIRLEADLPADLPRVEGDPQRLGQVLVNLVGNAVKFSAPGTCVTVRATATRTALTVAVVDAGPGISAEDQARLFRPFTQLETGNTRSVGGTGLGLSIAKALVEAHGGTIGLTSKPGEGSTFWFSLPCRQAAPT